MIYIINIKLLKKQIKALLESNMEEEFKDGLHTLLGDILDDAEEGNSITLKGVKQNGM